MVENRIENQSDDGELSVHTCTCSPDYIQIVSEMWGSGGKVKVAYPPTWSFCCSHFFLHISTNN